MLTKIIVFLVTAIMVVPLLFACQPVCVREEKVVGILKQESEPFAKFYEAERGKMPKQICWTENAELPWYTPAHTNTSTNTITLKQIPPSPEDDFMVAHELCAFLLQADGFPRAFPTVNASEVGAGDISSYLNSMLDTPLRDSILKKYGFDVEKAYKFYLGDALKGPSDVEDLAMKTKRLFFYVEMVLYWEDVLSKSETSDFQLKWSNWYPEVEHDGSVMLNKIRLIGYDSPEKMEAVYEDIISTWGLYEIVGLTVYE